MREDELRGVPELGPDVTRSYSPMALELKRVVPEALWTSLTPPVSNPSSQSGETAAGRTSVGPTEWERAVDEAQEPACATEKAVP